MKNTKMLKKTYLLAILGVLLLYILSFLYFFIKSETFSLAPEKPYNELIIFSDSTNAHIILKFFYYPCVFIVSGQKYCPNREEHKSLIKWAIKPMGITEDIHYATTDMSGQIIDFDPRTPSIYIEKNGGAVISGKMLNQNELKNIFGDWFTKWGEDLSIKFHVDKDTPLSTIKPILDMVSNTGGSEIFFVVNRGKSSDRYYFHAVIDKNKFKSKNLLEIFPDEILFNTTPIKLDQLVYYSESGNYLEEVKFVSHGEIKFQRLIDVLSKFPHTRREMEIK